MIFLTENDVLGGGEQVYHVERTILETGELFKDGAHIIYVNGSKIDETELGKFLHDMKCQNASDMYDAYLAQRVRYFKEDTEGVATVCKKVEEYGDKRAAEAAAKAAAESAAKLYKRKISLDEIADIVNYPVDMIKQWLGIASQQA